MNTNTLSSVIKQLTEIELSAVLSVTFLTPSIILHPAQHRKCKMLSNSVSLFSNKCLLTSWCAHEWSQFISELVG